MFITDFLKTFCGGHDNVRIGLVKYSDSPKLEFDMTKLLDVRKALKKVNHVGGRRNTGTALASMETYFTRPGSQQDSKYLVVISAGESADRVRGPAEKIRAQGVKVFAVGVKGSNQAQLQEISGDPVRTFTVSDYHFLNRIKDNILRQICGPAGEKTIRHILAESIRLN